VRDDVGRQSLEEFAVEVQYKYVIAGSGDNVHMVLDHDDHRARLSGSP
jgi:hypothetical protein